jgi:DNA repair exonuclease SbcCD ATPase subunit
MKYLYLELHGFKRMALNGLDHFAITFTAPLQIVLGTNGSGKSSLLGEITPYPAQASDFAKDGSKLIRVLHHEEVYTLKSTFAPSQKHSFVKGDVELNEGGTVTVQKELVKHYFGTTADVNDLLLGRELFDRMSPARRKEWFLRLCDTNYDYAIKAYNKLKEKHRDASGALRVAKKRLVQESEKLIDTQEEARLRAETALLHEQLAQLLECRKPVEQDLSALRAEQTQLDVSLTKLALSLQTLAHQQGPAPLSLEDLSARVERAEQARLRATTLIEQLTGYYSKAHTQVEVLQQAEQQTIDQLRATVIHQQQRQAHLSAQLIAPPLQDAQLAMRAFQTVKLTLSDLLTTLPENKLKRFGAEALSRARIELAQSAVLKNKLIEQLQAKRAQLAHQDAHKGRSDLQCPKCTHRFSLHYSEESHAALTEQVERLSARLDNELHPAARALQTYIEDCVQYGQTYRQYIQCTTSWPVLQPYWDYLSQSEFTTQEPSATLRLLNLIDKDLLIQLDLQTITTDVLTKQALIVSLQDVGGADLVSLQAQCAQWACAIELHTEELQSASQDKAHAVQCKQRALDIQHLLTRVTATIQHKRSLNKAEIESLRRTAFNQLIRTLQSALASREHTLSNLTTQKSIVHSFSQQIEDLEKDETAYAVLVKQLSPTEGLIAEGLLGFIKNFVLQMNALIKKVWTYPLVIQTCEVLDDASVDLDYKFAMSVMNADNLISDVSKGSAGMQEIVNLAFKLTAMRYLGLQHSAVYLDEFSAALDASHTTASVYLIKSLLEQQSFSQVFMISHDFAQYGALANAEVCVLNDLNIVVPQTGQAVNRHVVMR